MDRSMRKGGREAMDVKAFMMLEYPDIMGRQRKNEAIFEKKRLGGGGSPDAFRLFCRISCG